MPDPWWSAARSKATSRSAIWWSANGVIKGRMMVAQKPRFPARCSRARRQCLMILRSTSRVDGNVSYGMLQIEQGAPSRRHLLDRYRPEQKPAKSEQPVRQRQKPLQSPIGNGARLASSRPVGVGFGCGNEPGAATCALEAALPGTSATLNSVQRPFRFDAVERERRHLDVEMLAGLADHAVAADHEARRRLQRHAAGIFELLAGLEHRLLADDAGAAHLLAAAVGVGDAPMPGFSCTVSSLLLVMEWYRPRRNTVLRRRPVGDEPGFTTTSILRAMARYMVTVLV